jgi:serine/threonine protein kinase
MELCAFSLRDFLRAGIKVAMGKRFLESSSSDDNGIGCLAVWGIFEQITQGLVFIHSQKEVHRDLKPENGELTCYYFTKRCR